VVLTEAVEVWFDPLSVTEVGESVQVMVAGAPEQVRPTVPVNPLTGATVTVKVVDAVALTVREVGEAETVKFVPVPLSDTACGLLLALSLTLKVPLRVPEERGEKVT
jgi:hypothetical protein